MTVGGNWAQLCQRPAHIFLRIFRHFVKGVPQPRTTFEWHCIGMYRDIQACAPRWLVPDSPEWRKRPKTKQNLYMQSCGVLYHAANKQNHVFQNVSYGVTLCLPCIMYLSLTNSCTASFTSCSLWLELGLSIETMCLILNTSPPLQINQPCLMF